MGRWAKKIRDICRMEHRVCRFSKAWMELEITVLNEIIQDWKDFTVDANRLVISRVGEGRGEGEVKKDSTLHRS